MPPCRLSAHLIAFLTVACSFTAAVPKPIIALVPAAWHSPVHYQEFTSRLKTKGYDTVTQRLPSCGSLSPDQQSVARDTALIRQDLLLPSINAGKDIVVIMHSYGGGPGGAAAKGLSKADRQAAGLPGGIIGLIFISAFVAEEGKTLLDGSGGEFAPWVIEYGNGQLGVRDAKQIFYNGVSDELATSAVRQLMNQSRNSAETPCGAPAWSDTFYTGRRAYVLCTLDEAIPPFAQAAMIEHSGVKWDVEAFDTGHSPFLSQPDKLTTWTINEVSKFMANNADILNTTMFSGNPVSNSSSNGLNAVTPLKVLDLPA